jgi:hypothetical protein
MKHEALSIKSSDRPHFCISVTYSILNAHIPSSLSIILHLLVLPEPNEMLMLLLTSLTTFDRSN